jgi:hypothetical protein
LPESTIARSLPKSTGARLHDLDSVLLLEAVEEGLAHGRAHRPAGMIDDQLRGLGRLGLCEGGPGGADRGGASQQRESVTAVQALDVHDVSPPESPCDCRSGICTGQQPTP